MDEQRAASPRTTPDMILAGYGVADALQITVEAQQALLRATHVYAIAAPPRLVRHLTAQRLRVTDLAPRLQAEGGEAADAYLDIAGFILREAALDPPVALLAPGNPLFLNTLTRFLVQAARERSIEIAVYPGVSVLDALISDLGLDVSTRGLQVFDARHLVRGGRVVDPEVPLFVLQPAGLGALATERQIAPEVVHDELATHLARSYPDNHAVSLILETTGRGRFRHETRSLASFNELAPHLDGAAAIFCDAVRVPR